MDHVSSVMLNDFDEVCMKKAIYILLIIFISYSCNKTDENNGKEKNSIENYKAEYSIALNGLIIRQKPTLNSKKLMIIPFGEKIYIIRKSQDSKTIIIDKEEVYGYWNLIQYKKIIGYSFSHYLSSEKLNIQDVRVQKFIHNPIVKLNGISTSKDKENFIFGKYGKPKKITKKFKINRINKKQDTIKTYHYNNFKIEVYFAKQIKKQLVQNIYLKKGFIDKLKYNISFNMSSTDIMKIFGKQNFDNQLIYINQFFDTGKIIIKMKNNYIESITVDNTL